MTTFNPEVSSFHPVLIAPPTAFDIAYMRKTSRLRAASDPGSLPRHEQGGLELPIDLEDTPLLSRTSSSVDFEAREAFHEDGQFVTDPLRTPLIGPEPEQMYDEVRDPMFYYQDSFRLPPPALPMEPINEVASESQRFISNTMFGYDSNHPFPVPGPTHFIMERVFNRMYVDDTTYPGFTMLADHSEREQDVEDAYVVFGLNDPSEYTDFGRAMAAKHSVPLFEPFNDFRVGPAYESNEPLDMQPQLYCFDGTPFVHEGPDVLLMHRTPFDYLDTEERELAMESMLDPEAAEFTPPMDSDLNPDAPAFDMAVGDITISGVRTPSPRLRLAMQPLMMRAKRLSIKEEDLNLGRISWVDRSSWFPDSDAV